MRRAASSSSCTPPGPRTQSHRETGLYPARPRREVNCAGQVGFEYRCSAVQRRRTSKRHRPCSSGKAGHAAWLAARSTRRPYPSARASSARVSVRRPMALLLHLRSQATARAPQHFAATSSRRWQLPRPSCPARHVSMPAPRVERWSQSFQRAPSAVAITSAAGTTRFTNPSRSAVSASNGSPVSRCSMAILAGS